MNILELDKRAVQADFAVLVNVAPHTVSRHVKKGTLKPGGTYREWLLAYSGHLREVGRARSGADQQKLTRARTREANAKAESVEMANLETGGTLIVAAHVPPTLTFWAEVIKETVLEAVETACRKFESKHKVTLKDQDFIAPMRLTLEHLCTRAVEIGEEIVNTKNEPAHEQEPN